VGSGRGFYGTSLVFGALAATELLVVFLPKLTPIVALIDVIEIILEHIVPGLKGGHSRIVQVGIGLLLVWLASYAALEAFTRKFDGLCLWSHIAQNSCARLANGSSRLFLCTLSKWLATLLAAPFLIAWGAVRTTQTKTRMISAGYVTIDPRTLLQYMKHLALGVVFIIAVVTFASKLSEKKAAMFQSIPTIHVNFG
jgi:hypothetical protein